MPGKKHRRSVPDFIRRGLRQGLGVGALVAAGYEVVEPWQETSEKTASQWLTCFKWACITLIVLTAPVLGKVAQVSFERTIGTLMGGMLGLVTVLVGREMLAASDQVFTAIISGLVAFGAVCFGHRLKLEYAGKLLAMTFVLVVIGADERVDAFMVALTRCSGIILGVFLSVLLAVLIFPKSASHQATDSLAEALQTLCTLSKLAWNLTLPDKNQLTGSLSGGSADGYSRLQESSSGSMRLNIDPELKEAECEKVLMDLYNSLEKADEMLPLAKRERYMFTFRGKWCFLPAVPFIGQSIWTVPAKPMTELATALRKVSRVLWALHVTFKEGFKEEEMRVIQSRLPPDTMHNLQTHSYEALLDMQDSFPDDTILPNANLHKFLEAVENLINTSNEQRSMIMRYMGTPEFAGIRANSSGLGLEKPSSSIAGVQDARSLALQELTDGPQPIQLRATSGPLAGTSSDLNQSPFSDAWAEGKPGDRIQFNEDVATNPMMSASKIDGFPLTAAGYTSKMRWFSFQFLMQHLAEELEGMHKCLAVVLKMMPNALRAREHSV